MPTDPLPNGSKYADGLAVIAGAFLAASLRRLLRLGAGAQVLLRRG